eukprot:Lithocolla_globosa_v1_NODE_7419_length_949_cov_4.687919.p1 type:complete len:299 gc:universal NODE_7419_length_949_cov_4.687919:915-19(-)
MYRKTSLVVFCGFGVLWLGSSTVQSQKAHGSKHRAFDEREQRCLRTMQGQSVSHELNPGVHVEPMFIDEAEEQALLKDAKKWVKRYGKSHVSKTEKEYYSSLYPFLKRTPEVNMMRVTGRPERKDQHIAPWGYGEDFGLDYVPAQIRKLIEKIQQSNSFSLGEVRDVTINYRRDGFFFLTPHVDPLLDGENVFILGLGSDNVLTLCPPQAKIEPLGTGGLADFLKSWTDDDIDVLVEARTLVHLTSDARNKWKHGCRFGIEAKNNSLLCDWFGTIWSLVPRSEERYSIVVAFEDKKVD